VDRTCAGDDLPVPEMEDKSDLTFTDKNKKAGRTDEMTWTFYHQKQLSICEALGNDATTPPPLPTEGLLTLNASGYADDAVNEQAGERTPQGRALRLLWRETHVRIPLYVSRLRQEVLLHSHDEAQTEPSNARWKKIARNI
jgi:hypothetical protein